MKNKINPLTNDGQYADTTYKKAVEKMDRKKFLNPFVGRYLNVVMIFYGSILV